jgi:hypothetical protein
MKVDDSELWIWRHFAVRLPRDWEMLQFSCNARTGRCAFADRYAFRFELSWNRVPGPPDVDRMLSDYAAELMRDGESRPRRVRRAEWYGLEIRNGPESASRYGCYIGDHGYLLEAVFPWPSRVDRPLAHAVLDSIHVETANADGFRRWRAFGMEVLAPPGLDLQSCRVLPAQAEMVFADKRSRRELRVERLGMVSEWLRGSPTDWVKKTAPPHMAEAPACVTQRNGHDIVRLIGKSRGLPGRQRAVDERCGWRCPESGRLFGLSVKGMPAPSPSRTAWADCVGCCAVRSAAL